MKNITSVLKNKDSKYDVSLLRVFDGIAYLKIRRK